MQSFFDIRLKLGASLKFQIIVDYQRHTTSLAVLLPSSAQIGGLFAPDP